GKESESSANNLSIRINRMQWIETDKRHELLAATNIGLLLSFDNGGTWQTAVNGNNAEFFDIYSPPDGDGPVLARSAHAIYMATSNPEIWTLVPTPFPVSEINDVAVPQRSLQLPIFVATTRGLFAMNYTTRQWIPETNGLPLST